MRKSLTLAFAGLACSGAALAQNPSTTPTPVSTPPGAIAPGMNTPAAGGNLLYDNGNPDGVNGYSNATVAPFGARRTLLDDFTVPAGGWNVGCMEWNHLWASGAVGVGTGLELEIFKDNGGTPDLGASVTGGLVNVTAYTEASTGNVYFSRPEQLSTATFDTVGLGAGTYWYEATIVGPENNFMLTATQQANECWVNYSDLGGLQPGSAIFGVTSDLAWRLFEGGGSAGKVYCDETTNANNVSDISISSDTLGGPITVDLSNGPSGQFAYLLIGGANGVVVQPPGAKGDLCVAGAGIGRYALDIFSIDGSGAGSTDIQNSLSGGAGYGIPTIGGNIQSGDTWYFQYWHRQPMGQPATFSSALAVTFN